MSKLNSKPKSKPAIPPEVVMAYRLQAAGRLAEAEAACREVLALRPGQVETLDLLAQLCRQRGNLGEALRLYSALMKAARGSAEAASNHGVVLNDLDRPAEALASLDRALILKPDFAAAHYNRGNALFALDRYDEALRSFDRTLALDPTHVDAHYNRGNTLRELRRHGEALASYRHALALAPDRADIHVNEALTLLRMGNLREGFAAYEWRLRGAPQPLPAPGWRGAPDIAGKTIFLQAEQGFGDTLQFIRYAPLLAARGARVMAVLPAPLKPLVATMADVTALTAGDPSPEFDFHCPLMSLPLAFGTELATIPANVPYLHARPDRIDFWRHRLPATGRRIGVAWAGSAGFAGDRQRSMAFSALAPLLGTAGVAWVGLQREVPAGDLTTLGAAGNFVNIGPDLRDFADTAAVVAQLDLIIAVDTALVHLAGALAKPVWVMLPYSPDFRWMLDRVDSPWYPTARLFRQPTPGDWASVITRVAEEIGRNP